MSLSVVMVSYRTGPALFDALSAVIADPVIDELVLVDHDNPDADRARIDAIAAMEPRLTLVRTNANLGFAKGCNIGARAAQGDLLFFLNPDTVLPEGVAARLIETASGLREPFVLGARIVGPDGIEQRGGRRGALTLRSAVTGFLGLSRVLPFIRDVHREREPLPDGPVETPVVSGAAMVLSRAGFERLGGFDEGYFLHVEDIDLCLRAGKAGGAVVFEPRANVIHLGSTSRVGRLFVERWKARGLVRYFRLHGGRLAPLKAAIITPMVYGALFARAAVYRFREGPKR